MSKTKKIFLIILSIPVALLLTLILILKLTISESFIKSQITPIVENTTGRHLSVGSASVHLFPTFGITLENVTLSDDSLFSNTPFVKLDQFLVGLKLFPLLGKKVVVDEIGLSGLSVSIIKNQDGVFNFTSMTKPTNDKAPTTNDTTSTNLTSLNFLIIDDFHISHAAISYVDLQNQQHVSIHNLNYDLTLDLSQDNWLLNHTLTIQDLTFLNQLGFLTKQLPIALTQNLNYDYKKDHLSIKETDFSIGALKVGIQGDVRGIQDSIRDIQLVFESPETELQQVLSLVPASIVKQINDIQTRGKIKFSAAILGNISSTQLPKINYQFDLTNGYIKYSSMPVSLNDLELHIKGDDHNLENLTFSGSAKQSSVKMNVSVKNFEQPDVNIQSKINFNLSDVKDFYPLEPNQKLSGKINSEFSVAGKPLTPKTLKGSGQISFDHLSVIDHNLPKGIQEINGNLSINNDFILLDNFALIAGNSDIVFTGKITNYLGFILEPDSAKLIPNIQATLKSKNFIVSDFVDLDKEKVENKKEVEPTATAHLPILPNMKAFFSGTIDHFLFKDISANHTQAIIEIEGQTIKIKQTGTEIFGGKIASDADVRLQSDDLTTYQSKLNATDLKSKEFLTFVPTIESYVQLGKYLTGDISFTGNISGMLTDTLAPKLDAVSALGVVSIKNGILKDHPIQLAVASFLGLEEFKNLTLDNWTSGIEITDGKLFIKDLKASSKSLGLDAEANGYQSLDQTIRYEVTLHLPKWVTDKMSKSEYGKIAANAFTDSNNKILVDLLVSGKFNNPKIEPDITKSSGRAAGQLTQKVKDEANKKIEEAKNAAKKEADKAADDAKKKLEDEAKKKLKNLFGK